MPILAQIAVLTPLDNALAALSTLLAATCVKLLQQRKSSGRETQTPVTGTVEFLTAKIEDQGAAIRNEIKLYAKGVEELLKAHGDEDIRRFSDLATLIRISNETTDNRIARHHDNTLKMIGIINDQANEDRNRVLALAEKVAALQGAREAALRRPNGK